MWQSCKTPPSPYIRVEIKGNKGNKYLGFYAGFGNYLESYKHNIIKDAKWWRYPSPDSMLVKNFMEKLMNEDRYND